MEIEATEATTATSTETSGATTQKEELPPNRFELELEFIQALASPNYLHYLATSKSEKGDCLLLSEPEFVEFLKYLQSTWSRPEYSRFINYPNCLYFLELLIEKPSVAKEWTLPAFRNFCHQQQFLSWQHRHAQLYGRGTNEPPVPPATPVEANSDSTIQGETAATEGSQ